MSISKVLGLIWRVVRPPVAPFAMGASVPILVRVAGVEPWWHALAVGIALLCALTAAGAQAHWAWHGYLIKQIRQHLAARRYEDAEVKLELLVEELQWVSGRRGPPVLRWSFLLAHVHFHTGQRAQAVDLLGFVLDVQRRTLGPDHPDTRRSMWLAELATFGDPRSAAVEIWLRD